MDIVYAVLALLTGIGVFFTGMLMLSSSLKKASTHKMNALFKKIGNNRFSGVALGTGVTAVIQSSSAATVMVVGLVNVGVLTLFQATAIIIGANIGTTLTSIIVGLSFFNVKYLFMSLVLVGIVFKMTAKKERTKVIGEVLMCIGILFVGLDLMSAAFKSYAPLRDFFMDLFATIKFPVLLILLGALFTVVVQSSSASLAIYISMVASGILDFGTAVYLVLGTEMGTCITAVLASIGANRAAKQAALAHFLFNAFGMLFFTALIWPLHGAIIPWYTRLVPSPVWQVAIFPLVKNLVSAVIMIWFISPFNRLVCFMIKDKPDSDEVLVARFTDAQLLNNPAAAIAQLMKGINYIGQKSKDNLESAFSAIISDDLSAKEKIEKEEAGINTLTQSLADYLVKISSASISITDQTLAAGLHHVLSDIERIGDQAVMLIHSAAKKIDVGAKFSDAANEEVTQMFAKVMHLFNVGLESDFLNAYYRVRQKNQDLKQEIDEFRDQIADTHIKRMQSGTCVSGASEYYYAIITALKSVTDHLFNIDKILGRLSRRQPKSNKDNNINQKAVPQLRSRASKVTVKKTGVRV